MAWVIVAALAAVVATSGCTQPAAQADQQIRERIASIRTAILERRAEGIVHWGTDDWSFTGPDGKSVDKAAYLERAKGLMQRVVSVDSLETKVDQVVVHGETADVEITQTMERHEREAATGNVLHLRLRYREHHVWVRASDGWRVKSVAFIGAVDRHVISTTGGAVPRP
jgi:ketosteroid isomerase-like protein